MEQDRQYRYKSNTEGRLRKNCCCGKQYCECVSVALVIRHVIFMCIITVYCYLEPLWLYHIISHYLTKGIFSYKKLFNLNSVF